MITARWNLEPEAKVWVRKARNGVFASYVESERYGTHSWPTAIDQPRVILRWEGQDVEVPGNRAVALVFEDGVEKW